MHTFYFSDLSRGIRHDTPEGLDVRQQLLGFCSDSCENLRKLDSGALGFFPKSEYPKAIVRDRVCFAQDGQNLVGFLFWGLRDVTLRIQQLVVDKAYRRRKIGTALLLGMINHPDAREAVDVHLQCREDLDANHFWKALGFTVLCRTLGGSSRGKAINHWHKEIDPNPEA
jgi:ribosomal protein S18 acetylase RimI-like enzyme